MTDASRLSRGTLAESLKNTTLGVCVGVASGTLSQAVGNELVSQLALGGNTASEAFARLIIRSLVAAPCFVLGGRLLSATYHRGYGDVTEGVFYWFAFAGLQSEMQADCVTLSRALSGRVRSAAKMRVLPPTSKGGDSCCDDCSKTGGSCGGK